MPHTAASDSQQMLLGAGWRLRRFQCFAWAHALGVHQMVGERSTSVLVRTMDPRVHPELFVFCSFADFVVPAGVIPICVFREAEGLTAIVPQAQAMQLGLKHEFVAGLITLNVQSDLSAVGFLATVTQVLSEAGVPCNVVSAFHHDHLFVAADRVAEAQQLLLRHARKNR